MKHSAPTSNRSSDMSPIPCANGTRALPSIFSSVTPFPTK